VPSPAYVDVHVVLFQPWHASLEPEHTAPVGVPKHLPVVHVRGVVVLAA
jgi:hypothetical protein